MQDSWIVLLPTALLLIMAMITKDVIKSLLSGIILGAFIAKDFNIKHSLTLIIERIFQQTQIKNLITLNGNYDNLYAFSFLILLGAIISLITRTGAMEAYTRTIKKIVTSAKKAQIMSLSLSSFFFMDDYLGTLTVGSVMKPVTDQFAIPRIKLAFLLDSTSSAMCTLIPASSWIAIILSQLQGLNISNSFEMYLNAIPFLFYSILIVFTAWLVVILNISFGKMHEQEKLAKNTGDLFGGKAAIVTKSQKEYDANSSLIDFFMPISMFMTGVFIIFTYTGSWTLFGGINSLGMAFQQGDPFLALFISSLVTLIISSIYFIITTKIKIKDVGSILYDGLDLMKRSIMLIILAKTISMMLQHDLQTGKYLAGLLVASNLPSWLMPFIFFVVTTVVAMSTGTSWGTIGIMIPIAIPTINLFAPYLISPALGAVVSGSISGAHLTPISDPMLISATSAGAHHMDHVQTQMSYSIPAIIGSSAAFLIAGIFTFYGTIFSAVISLITGITVTTLILILRNQLKK